MASASSSIKKYPKTPHLHFSPGVADDDDVISINNLTRLPILNGEVVVTEKLDGGNTCFYNGKVYARTTNSEATHASFGPIKQLFSSVSFMIPDNLQIFGENMFGIHSIEYDKLESYYYIFGVLEDGITWLSWERVRELSDMLGIPTVPEITRKQFNTVDELKSFIESQMRASSECGSCRPEGFVIRTVQSFSYDELDKNVVKYVRKNHVQTNSDWRLKWKQAKLRKP